MPNYINNGICLTEEETSIFRERLTNPSSLAAKRRDAFLDDIARNLVVTPVDGGILIEDEVGQDTFEPNACEELP